MKRKITLLFLSVIIVLLSFTLFAAEHKGIKIKGEEEARVKKAALTYIDEKIKQKGSFEIHDVKESKIRKLKFDYFHTINKLENGDYFFCADFIDGKDRLDLDFTMLGKELKVKSVTIHKVNGESR